MKFINYLTSITGVEVYPMISLIMFFAFFVLLGIYVATANKEHINSIKNLPIE